jgi:pyrimidine-specific ribonucleoside hydrolase
MRPTIAVVLFLVAVCAHAQKPAAIVSTDVAMGLDGGFRPGWCDPDDAWAIALAWKTLDVRAIAVTYGNNYVEPEMASLRTLLAAAGKQTPHERGAAVKLTDPQVFLGDKPLAAACENDAVRRMAALLHGKRMSIVAIGPLTDLACLVLNAPKAAANIREIVAIMGRAPNQNFAIGTHTGLTDFNYVNDPRAVSVILQQSKIPVTFMTFALTSSTLVTQRQAEALAASPRKLPKTIGTMTLPWVAQWQKVFGEAGFHPWDANAVWYVAHPPAYACTPAAVQIVNCGTPPYYRDANNPCAGHGPDQKPSMDKESSQLWLNPTSDVAARARACTAFANDGEKQRFLEAIVTAAGSPPTR